MTHQKVIIHEIIVERLAQDAKWGVRNHTPEKWLAILGEEFGEACKACLEGQANEFRREMVQVAAVALACLEFTTEH